MGFDSYWVNHGWVSGVLEGHRGGGRSHGLSMVLGVSGIGFRANMMDGGGGRSGLTLLKKIYSEYNLYRELSEPENLSALSKILMPTTERN